MDESEEAELDEIINDNFDFEQEEENPLTLEHIEPIEQEIETEEESEEI